VGVLAFLEPNLSASRVRFHRFARVHEAYVRTLLDVLDFGHDEEALLDG
jgi:hypothetical protein